MFKNTPETLVAVARILLSAHLAVSAPASLHLLRKAIFWIANVFSVGYCN
jgi:hypothetical protein